MMLGILIYLFEVTTAKVNFRFYKQYSHVATRLICKRATFAQMVVSIFSSNIPLYTEKNSVEKLGSGNGT